MEEKIICEDCKEVELTDAVVKYSKENYDGKQYCFNCQQNHPTVETHDESGLENKKWQDDIVNYETLLNDAHEKFGKNMSIKTGLVAYDIEKKFAIVKAVVEIIGGQVFEAHGDATEQNVTSSLIKPHFIRMAETRAIARALRWATNNAKTAEEEKA